MGGIDVAANPVSRGPTVAFIDVLSRLLLSAELDINLRKIPRFVSEDAKMDDVWLCGVGRPGHYLC